MNIDEIVIYGAGWRNLSLVDIHGYTSFTLWLCGCNLKCPFCHNWRLADNDKEICRQLNLSKLIEDLSASLTLIDFLHITGGEPLLQYTNLKRLLEYLVNTMNLKISINSNLTLYTAFSEMIKKDLIHHVATDIKIPPYELYGLTATLVERYWENFLKSLKLIGKYDLPLELRIPVHKKLAPETLSKYINEVVKVLGDHVNRTIVVINPLLGKPVVTPRDQLWCEENCFPPESTLNNVAKFLQGLGFKKIVIKSSASYPF
ncbi:MAG: anaerobic ribonucleoside-triphosphate reductase activating protein [Desulfurococcaceae archaeon]